MKRLLSEPPFRIVASALVKRFSRTLRSHELWDTWDRPAYLTGILSGADQAVREGRKAMTVIEFGVASGRGLLSMQRAAQAVERETGIEIHVFGFDSSTGLSPARSGYRDHPDQWQAGDFPMIDRRHLESQLSERTKLILGDVEETVEEFLTKMQQHPLGFVSYDLDYYSSTMSALKVLSSPKRNNLIHLPLYFDDTFFFGSSDYAGERLAIREFNESDCPVKIDPWHILHYGRPFPERRWLGGMYVANDLGQMERFVAPKDRTVQLLPL